MEKVAMLPTVTDPASASPLRSLERMMQEALESVTSLRCEVAELKILAAALREEVSGTVVEANKEEGVQFPLNATKADPNFDWDAWARETKARIRGEHLTDRLSEHIAEGAS